jgi:hypothetical protein
MPSPDHLPTPAEEERRHLHVRLTEARTSVLDLVTEYLQAAGKAPDWYWRTAGRLEGNGRDDADNMEELIVSAFEAGAYIAHDHPEDLKFEWVSEEECERERRQEERGQQREEGRKEQRPSLSHYA